MKRNPTLKKIDEKVYADDKLVKELTHKDIEDNFVIFRLPSDPDGFIVFAENSFYLYLMENEEEAEKLAKGKRGFPMFPVGMSMSMSFQTDGFKTFWKHPDAKGVIGCIWMRFRDNDEIKMKVAPEKHIFIEMMAVRKGFTRNNINRLMLNKLMEHFDVYKVDFGSTTPMGEKFAKSFHKETGNRLELYAPNASTRS